MPQPADPMLPYLVDLEAPYEADVVSDYDPHELVRYALGVSDYWAGLALAWLDQGAPHDGLNDALAELERRQSRPQALRHHARRVRMGR